MATNKKIVKKSFDDKPERFRFGEMGYLGLSIFNGISKAELKKELTFPHSIDTYKQMSYHSTINSALTLFDNLIGKVDWKVIPPHDATDEEIEQCNRISEMMHDMEHPFSEFISNALTMSVYGFSVHEKVFRRRNLSSGSMHDDGLIGWKKLPIRSQETIEKFIFSEDGNEVTGVKQNLTSISDNYNRYSSRELKVVVLPKNKILIFKSGKNRGDPYGKSSLRDAYLAWRYLTALEEIEANGVARDLQGMPVLKIPPQYMSSDASAEQKQIYEYYKNVLRNIQMNSQSGLILPQVIDPDSRQPLFNIELLSTAGGKKSFDTTQVKEYYKNLILTSLFADVLTLGQGATGSFALGQLKNSLSGSAASAILKNITEVINNDLVKQTYVLNGWNPARMGRIDYDNLETVDLEAFSKAIQRFASVSALEIDRATLNRVRESVGIDKLSDNEEPQEQYLGKNTSRSGDGMGVGKTGNGTSNEVASQDNSTQNLDNLG